MAEYLAIRDGGKTNEEGATRLINKLAGSNNEGVVGSTDLAVSQNGTPNMSVNVAAGDIVISYLDYLFHGWLTATKNVSVNAADPTNPRKDRVVAYVDLSVVSSASSNNPNALKLKSVAGTPAGSPTAPNDAAVQTSVGAGNPWSELAELYVIANDTSIVTGDITDKRAFFIMGGGIGGAAFSVNGSLAVANNLTPYWIAARAGSFTYITARVRTAPTGASLNLRITKNGVSFTTLNISAGAQTATAAIAGGTFSKDDYFGLDCTQIGSTVAGADLSLTLI